MEDVSYYSNSHLMLWSEMSNDSHRAFHSGFPTGTSLESLFPYHDKSGNIGWQQVFSEELLDHSADSEEAVKSTLYRNAAAKLDQHKRHMFGGSSVPASIEEFVSH